MITVGQETLTAPVHTVTKRRNMAYDDNFFKMYAEYLLEPTVRANHDIVFDMFDEFVGHPKPSHVIDLGCGLGEYARWGTYTKYCGIDNVLRISSDEASMLPGFVGSAGAIQHDYLYPDALRIATLSETVDTFVSMFSVELVVPEVERAAFYTNLFETCPTLKYGLSAGFYYASLAGQASVGETGGIISCQTIDKPYDHPHPFFTETRIVMETPSKMFGKDVVEVYKLMRRIKR